VGNDHLLRRLLPLVTTAALVAGCSSAERPAADIPSPSAVQSTPPAGSDADLPLDPASSVPAVEGVPAATVATLRAELSSVWGVRLTGPAGGTLRGAGTDAPSGVRFAVTGRADGARVRGYACTATPADGAFSVPTQSGDGEPDPDVLAAMETAMGFLQTCANSAAADPDRATVWVRAVAQQALTGTPAERRIGGARFRLERAGGGLRLSVGTP
jgi:hypothetical protein